MKLESAQRGRHPLDVRRSLVDAGQDVEADADEQAMALPGLDAFGEDPAQLAAIDLDVIGPANADSRIGQTQSAYGLDHGGRRHQGQSRLLVDAQAVGRGIERDGEG